MLANSFIVYRWDGGSSSREGRQGGEEATDTAGLAPSAMTSFFRCELLLGTRQSGLKVQQFGPVWHNRDAPLLFVECSHLPFERLPLLWCDVPFGRLEILRRHAINDLDTSAATHK